MYQRLLVITINRLIIYYLRMIYLFYRVSLLSLRLKPKEIKIELFPYPNIIIVIFVANSYVGPISQLV
jgi:hypothetical protein